MTQRGPAASKHSAAAAAAACAGVPAGLARRGGSVSLTVSRPAPPLVPQDTPFFGGSNTSGAKAAPTKAAGTTKKAASKAGTAKKSIFG